MNDESLNQIGTNPGDIIAFIARLTCAVKERGEPFDTRRLGPALRDRLPDIAGRVPDDAFFAIAGICAELMNDGAQAMLADHLARIAVSKAKKESQ